ncbi:MAG TPA: M15 family metallopeptidase [Nocardioides sp.]|nr:M15 family metallopeptidase [Nocardioides sp.]
MTILLSDPRVAAIEVIDAGEPLVLLDEAPGVRVRAGLAQRLAQAHLRLPAGLRLKVVEGHRSAGEQQRIISVYGRELSRLHPDLAPDEIERLSSRFVAPLGVAPHVAGAAVDLTLTDADGRDLDLGTPIDATPEQSDGACYFDSPAIPGAARELRGILRATLEGVGFVNYPTEWWHWSFGDRYWALLTGSRYALYGPVIENLAA